MRVDDEDYFLDLLFYHRTLRCLVAVDLKIGAFVAADKGQMGLVPGVAEAARMAEGGERAGGN